MTGILQKRIKIQRLKISEKAVAGLLPLTFFMLLLKDPTLAAGSALRGLRLCAEVVIPSLFPFAVLSGMMIGNGLLLHIPHSFTRPLQHMLGLSHAGACVLLPCVLCGFPMGAGCVADAVEKGMVTEEEGERLLLFCNLPSPAFCIGTVGATLWGSRVIGLQLYAVTIFAAATVGILTRPKLRPTESKVLLWQSNDSTASLLTASLKNAAQAMLSVSACVVFFTAISEIVRHYLIAAALPIWIASAIDYLLELSGAASRGALPGNPMALLLCAFGTGWSGLSVHCQILTVCESKGLKAPGYLVSKMLQGILAAILMRALILLFNST